MGESEIEQFLVTVLALVVTLVVCRASWEYFEKPLVQLGHRVRYERGKEPRAKPIVGAAPESNDDSAMTAVIQADGLGKQYRRGVAESRGMLRDTLARVARSPLSAFRRSKQETFWALQNVSLQVKEGDVKRAAG